MKQYALVTGASQGLGKAFAVELARRKINTILVSLPNENLQALNCELIDQYQIDSHCFETDLSVTENVVTLAKQVNEQFNIFMLINNAGIGGSKVFTKVETSYLTDIIQVNIVATTVLIHKLLPNLLRQPKGYILNVSSLAAFSPMGFKTVYPASKAFIYHFSRGLSEELKATSVFVSVVNPGPMATNGGVSSRLKKQGILGKLALSNVENIAKTSLTQLYNRNPVIRVSNPGRLLLKWLPLWIKLPIMTRRMKREADN